MQKGVDISKGMMYNSCAGKGMKTHGLDFVGIERISNRFEGTPADISF